MGLKFLLRQIPLEKKGLAEELKTQRKELGKRRGILLKEYRKLLKQRKNEEAEEISDQIDFIDDNRKRLATQIKLKESQHGEWIYGTLPRAKLKISNRPCEIYFFPPKVFNLFVANQNIEPQEIEGEISSIDNSNIRISDKPSYSFPSIEKKMAELAGLTSGKDIRVMNAEHRINIHEQGIREKFSGYSFYIFKNNLYYFDDSDLHTPEEQKLLIKEHYFKQERKFKRLQKDIRLFEKLEAKEIEPREPIPEDVRFAVWRRDGGKCVKCGSKKNLEFDHVIPKSKGGSDSERNIQLLCQKCNREKSDRI